MLSFLNKKTTMDCNLCSDANIGHMSHQDLALTANSFKVNNNIRETDLQKVRALDNLHNHEKLAPNDSEKVGCNPTTKSVI